MSVINVLIADDHQIFRDGIKALLKEDADVDVKADAANGLEVLDVLREKDIDVVLMDINMPEMNGIDATKRIREEFPNVHVLVLSMHNEEQYIMRMMNAGAQGYILKNTGRQELLSAIRALANGDSYFCREVSDTLWAQLTRKNRTAAKQFGEHGDIPITEREIEVLKLIAEELTNHEIAERLFISPRTVDTHRRNLLQKLNVKNTAGLVKYALKHDLI